MNQKKTMQATICSRPNWSKAGRVLSAGAALCGTVAFLLLPVQFTELRANLTSHEAGVTGEDSEVFLHRLEWRGVISVSKSLQFSLYDSEKRAGFWLGMNETRSGVSVARYDEDAGQVTLRHGNATRTFSLNRSSTRAGTVPEDASRELLRFYSLAREAKDAFDQGELEDARRYATELLALSERYAGDWNYGNAIHDAHMVLGRLALTDGRIEEAKELLLKSGRSPGSPQLDTFGPNMSLARDLLAAGESEAVLEYFDLTRSFWEMGQERLDRWTSQVHAGAIPDFQVNLHF